MSVACKCIFNIFQYAYIPNAQIIIKKTFEIIDGDCYTFNENHSFSENYWLHSSNLKEDGH